jgi:putative Holliday junction resolvase
MVDERYSSAVLPQRRGQNIDAEAAAIILQQYLDNHDPS